MKTGSEKTGETTRNADGVYNKSAMSQNLEESNLLAGVPAPPLRRMFFRSGKKLSRRALVFLVIGGLVLLGVAAVVLVTLLPLQQPPSVYNSNHVVIMLADGFGPASVSMARAYLNYTGERDRLHLDDYLVGSVQTASLDSRVTDSAAGATAWSCGIRTFNNYVATMGDNVACGTVMEAAKAVGKKVGIVVKSRVTNASPASFSSHSQDRDREQFIAHQQIRQGFDLILGGGNDVYSFPYGGESSALEYAKETGGYTVVRTRAELAAVTELPLLGLFAEGTLKYDIDRLPRLQELEPSLKEMTTRALELLVNADTKKKGILLFVEGSMIDLAGHANDAATQVREAAGYDDTFHYVVDEWVPRNPNSLVLSFADHATGGLTLGTNYPGPSYPNPYAFYVKRFAKATKSLEALADMIISEPVYPFTALVNATVAFSLSAEQETNLRQWQLKNDTMRFVRTLGEFLSASDLIGWSTWGHDAVDINLYCAGDCQTTVWTGSHRNDILGQRLVSYLGLSQVQQMVSNNLTAFNTSGNANGWMGE